MSDRGDVGGTGPGAAGGEARRRSRTLSDDEVLRAVPPRAGAREFRVGIFVILGVVGFLTVLFLMTSPAMFRGRYMIYTEVMDAQGMRKGDAVRMRGVNIGRVYAFDLAPNGGVRVTLEVEDAYPIPAPATTELFSMGVLGGMVVSVIPGGGPGLVEAGDVLPGVTRAAMLEAADEIAGQVQDVMVRIQAVLTDATVGGIEGSVLAARDLLRELSALTSGRTEQLDSLMAVLTTSAANVAAITDPEDWDRTRQSADSAMATVRGVSASIEATLASVDGVLALLHSDSGTVGKLLTTSEMHDSVTATLGSLRQLFDDIRANPGRYVTIEIF